MIRCPQCRTEIGHDWDWCHACGWDPEGLRPDAVGPQPGAAARAAAAPARPIAPPPFPSRAAAPGPYGAASPSGAAPGPRGPRRNRMSGGGIALIVILVVVGLVAIGVVGYGVVDTATAPTTVLRTTTLPDRSAPTEWTPWTASDGLFGVEVPAPPEVFIDDRLTEGLARTEAAVARFGPTTYVLTFAQLDPNYEFVETFDALNRYLDSMATDPDPVLFSSRTRGTHVGYPSLSFTGSVANREGTVQGVVFIAGNRIYSLSTIAFETYLVDYDHFVASFWMS